MESKTAELIAYAKERFKEILERCARNCETPSYFEMFFTGYSKGLIDAGNNIKIDKDWHYIKLEGNPSTDDRCWCLIQADGYKTTELGWHDPEENKWHCDYWCASYEKVIAWHMLPREND